MFTVPGSEEIVDEELDEADLRLGHVARLAVEDGHHHRVAFLFLFSRLKPNSPFMKCARSGFCQSYMQYEKQWICFGTPHHSRCPDSLLGHQHNVLLQSPMQH